MNIDQLHTVPCPACSVKALVIENRLRARPLGTWSLAGYQPKTSAIEWPHLVCTNCGVSAPAKEN